jgi:ribosomal protein L28
MAGQNWSQAHKFTRHYIFKNLRQKILPIYKRTDTKLLQKSLLPNLHFLSYKALKSGKYVSLGTNNLRILDLPKPLV